MPPTLALRRPGPAPGTAPPVPLAGPPIWTDAQARTLGYVVGGSLDLVRPLDVEPGEWRLRLGTLAEVLLVDRDAEAALAWFRRELPEGLARIPWWRRGAFVAGVAAGARETDLGDARP